MPVGMAIAFLALVLSGIYGQISPDLQIIVFLFFSALIVFFAVRGLLRLRLPGKDEAKDALLDEELEIVGRALDVLAEIRRDMPAFMVDREIGQEIQALRSANPWVEGLCAQFVLAYNGMIDVERILSGDESEEAEEEAGEEEEEEEEEEADDDAI